MQIEYFLLADHAQISEGKLYLSGGGWSHLTADRPLPIRQRVGLAIGIRFDPDDVGKRHVFRIEMQTPNGLVELGSGRFETERIEGPSDTLIVAINAELPIASEGGHHLILTTDDSENKRTIAFQVTAPPPASV
jgi:hypothetical protein